VLKTNAGAWRKIRNTINVLRNKLGSNVCSEYEVRFLKKSLSVESSIQALIGPIVKTTAKVGEDSSSPLKHICKHYPAQYAKWLHNCTVGSFEAPTHSTRLKGISKASYGAIGFVMAQVRELFEVRLK